MSASERARLGSLAVAMLVGEGHGPRAARLGRMTARARRPAVSIEALGAAPTWLGLPEADRRRLGHRAALASISQHLEASVDGAWLGGMARVAGDAALDWAMTVEVPALGLARFEASGLDAVANGILRAALPSALQAYAAPAAPVVTVDPPIAAAALAVALAAA